MQKRKAPADDASATNTELTGIDSDMLTFFDVQIQLPEIDNASTASRNQSDDDEETKRESSEFPSPSRRST